MSQAQDSALQAKIASWRARAMGHGEPLSLDEMREAITALRAGRVSAAAASEGARRKKAKADIPDADSLLDSI